jgi:hypothetical protein
MSNTLDALMAAQTPAARTFFVGIDGKPVLLPEAEVQARLQAGTLTLDAPACLKGEQAWKKLRDYVAPPVAAPAEAPGLPPALPAAEVVKPATVVEAVRVAPAATTATTTAVVASPVMALAADPATEMSSEQAMSMLERSAPSFAATVEDEAAATAFLEAAAVASSIQDRLMAEATESEPMVSSHSFLYTNFTANGWREPKSTPPEHQRYLPPGMRNYTCIYLSYRLAGIGWVGEGGKGKTGRPPKWQFALQGALIDPRAVKLADDVTGCARLVQYATKEPQPGKFLKSDFDAVGRMALSAHVLVWTPQLGFHLLCFSNFDSVVATVASVKALSEAKVNGQKINPFGAPVCVCPETETKINKKVHAVDPNAKNAKWDMQYCSFNLSVDQQESKPVYEQFEEFKRTRRLEFATKLQEFWKASDFNGMSTPEVEALVKEYGKIQTR